MLHEFQLVSMFVLKYFLQGRFVAEIREGAYFWYFRVEASYGARLIQTFTDHQNYAYKVLAQTVKTGLR